MITINRDYCLRVSKLPMSRIINKESLLDFEKIKTENILYQKAYEGNHKGRRHLPEILFGAHKLLTNDRHRMLLKSGEYRGNVDGVSIWDIVRKCEPINSPEQIYEHGVLEYFYALMHLIDLVHEIRFVVCDWKIYNMGWGYGLDGELHFVLLDFDLYKPDGRVFSTHNIPATKIAGMYKNRTNDDTVDDANMSYAADWYVLIKEIYSVIKSHEPENSTNQVAAYNMLLRRDDLDPLEMFRYVYEQLQEEVPGIDEEEVSENDDEEEVPGIDEEQEKFSMYMNYLNNILHEYFQYEPFNYSNTI